MCYKIRRGTGADPTLLWGHHEGFPAWCGICLGNMHWTNLGRVLPSLLADESPFCPASPNPHHWPTRLVCMNITGGDQVLAGWPLLILMTTGIGLSLHPGQAFMVFPLYTTVCVHVSIKLSKVTGCPPQKVHHRHRPIAPPYYLWPLTFRKVFMYYKNTSDPLETRHPDFTASLETFHPLPEINALSSSCCLRCRVEDISWRCHFRCEEGRDL